jgi:tRNA/rRNA methyltransferase
LVNAEETEVIARDRAARRAWLEARGYRVCLLNAGDVERDVAGELNRLAGI